MTAVSRAASVHLPDWPRRTDNTVFGLSLEKLIVLAIFAGLIIGPHRLTSATRTLTDTVRSLRAYVDTARSRAVDELGVPLTRTEWNDLNLHRFDPRHLVREALSEPATAATSTPAEQQAPASPLETPDGEDLAVGGEDRIRPGQRYITTGDAAHPRRILISDLAPDDPRRLQAETIDRQRIVLETATLHRTDTGPTPTV
ncbi:hypothetical protein ACIGEP_16345 [Microbacterium sp. NPDC077663]|uniref:hypothetical protein n=1 Tax=Microbacterium sp. NPDC077663 TaxID=3364189 RepID=UPI0037C926D1